MERAANAGGRKHFHDKELALPQLRLFVLRRAFVQDFLQVLLEAEPDEVFRFVGFRRLIRIPVNIGQGGANLTGLEIRSLASDRLQAVIRLPLGQLPGGYSSEELVDGATEREGESEVEPSLWSSDEFFVSSSASCSVMPERRAATS